MSVPNQEREDAILDTVEVLRLEIARKQIDDETIFRFVIVFGNDTLGYIASSEEWFQPQRRYKPEFYEVQFQTGIYPTVAGALADALPSAIKEATDIGEWQTAYKKEREAEGRDFSATGLGILDGPVAVEPVAPKPATLDPTRYEIFDGYIGSLGKTYKPATAETLAEAITGAAAHNSTTEEEIRRRLNAGEAVKWCYSFNYYYDHGEGVIRPKTTHKPVLLVKCDCGHSVPVAQRMSASLGTSCPDCYDRMSA